MKTALFVLFIALVVSCKKGSNDSSPTDPVSPENKAKAAAMSTFLQANKFHLTRYYSDTPIDYIDTDAVVKSETELWSYVSPWLKDDSITFSSDGNVQIEQGPVRIPTADSSNAVLTRKYAVTPDKDGVAFQFLGHEYQPLDYRLVSFTDTSLLIWATWNGKKVNSEFKTTR